MKLLVVASSLDLRVPLGVTPSMWQLLKALAEQGVELVVAPYQGPSIETPWWTGAANPCQLEGDVVAWLKHVAPSPRPRVAALDDSAPDRLTRGIVERVTKPRWRKHLMGLIEQHRDFDALLFQGIPPNHFGGVPSRIESKFGLPTYFYDGDVPASLPRYAGFRTGFRIYQGTNLREYAAVLSNSVGGAADLEALGARQVHVVHYAADPSLLRPLGGDQDIDVFFYGHGSDYREQWIEAMLARPARMLPELRFAVRGNRLPAMPRVVSLPYMSFSKLGMYCSRSRVNLLITRHAHATVYASSTARIFELAAMGCAMVTNPYAGVAEWFVPGREILVVNDAHEAIETYRRLAADPATRRELGDRARARLVAEHTYAHRAAQIRAILRGDIADPASVRPKLAGCANG